jgi:toxin ParE1/3/4
MKIIYSDQFRAELCCVMGRYRTDDPDLAERFVNSVEAATAEVQEDPLRWRIIEGRVRRYLVRRFPYIIYYLVEDELLYFGALLHTARHPDSYRASFENL